MSDFDLGRHEQAIELLLAGQTRVERAIMRIEQQLAERKGERRVTIWAFSAASAFIGAATSVALRLAHIGPK